MSACVCYAPAAVCQPVQHSLLPQDTASTPLAAAEPASAPGPVMESGLLRIGVYSIGSETDENLYGHPEIRY